MRFVREDSVAFECMRALWDETEAECIVCLTLSKLGERASSTSNAHQDRFPPCPEQPPQNSHVSLYAAALKPSSNWNVDPVNVNVDSHVQRRKTPLLTLPSSRFTTYDSSPSAAYWLKKARHLY